MKPVNDQSDKPSTSGSEEKTGTATNAESKSSKSTNAAGVKAKVETAEDHKKLKCLGRRNTALKHCIIFEYGT